LDGFLKIADAAKHSGLPIKSVRYYADIGLIVPRRSPNGYRDFDDNDVQRLAAVRRARALGFSLDDCRKLLTFYAHKTRASARDLKQIDAFIARIDQREAELKLFRATLQSLVEREP